MKKYLLLIFLFIIPIVFSAKLEECSRHGQLTKDIPCLVTSSFIPITGCNQTGKIFDIDGTFIQDFNWTAVTPACQFTWNITSPIQTYNYNSSIENGALTLLKEDNMLSIILVQIFIIIFFVAIGLPHKVGFVKFFMWGLALIEFLMTVWIIYLNEVQGNITGLLYWNAMICLIVGGGFGLFSIIIMNIRLMNISEDSKLDDDGYVKYVGFGKQR